MPYNCQNGNNDGIGPNFPFYDGPFPPAPPPPVPAQRYDEPVYGFFYQPGELRLTAGGAIPFSGRPTATRNLSLEAGEITLPCAGSYMVSYNMAVPENCALETDLYLTLNGAAVLGSLLHVDKNGTNSTMASGGQAIVRAPAGARLSLVTSDALNIAACQTTLASLAVRRLD
ncbi:MAG: hypothetical protein IKO07_00780 [Clostridia bacterium]|nr:hypothetical protein [Clostridia bacterium]